MRNIYSINSINILLGATEGLMLKSKQIVKIFLPVNYFILPSQRHLQMLRILNSQNLPFSAESKMTEKVNTSDIKKEN